MSDSDIPRQLYDASGDGVDTRVRELLGAGADPDKYRDSDGDTALIRAAGWGKVSTVSILIQHGADLNIQDNDGKTALQRATWNGKYEFTTKLIKAGADLNIKDKDGKTIFLDYSNVIARLEYQNFIPN